MFHAQSAGSPAARLGGPRAGLLCAGPARLRRPAKSSSGLTGRRYPGHGLRKTHVGKVLARIGARDRAHAVITADEAGFAKAD